MDTFEKNSNFDKIFLDDVEILKSSFEVVDRDSEIIKFSKNSKEIYVNLKAVKTVRFEHIPTREEAQKYHEAMSNLFQQR